MTAAEVVEQLLRSPPAARQGVLNSLTPHLSLDVIRALKQRVDEEKLRNARRALEWAELMQAVASALASPEAQAWERWARGNALHHLSIHQEALTCYQQAEAYFAAHEHQLEMTILQVNQVAVRLELGDFRAALSLADQARARCLALAGPGKPYLALLEMNAGVAHRQLGELLASLAAYERAHVLFSDLGNTTQMARVDNNRAFALLEMDRFAEAESLLRHAATTLAAAGQAQEVARLDLNLGVLAYRRGHYLDALRYLEAAQQGFAAIPNPLEEATVALWRSFVYRHLDLGEEMIALAGMAAQAFRRHAMPWYRAAALVNQASGYRHQGDLPHAAAGLAQARRLWQRQGAAHRVWELDAERADLLLAQGQTVAAGRLARRGLQLVDPATWPALAARWHLLLALVAQQRRPPQLSAAQRQIAAGQALAETHELHEVLIQAYHQQGQCHEQQGDAPAALAAYRRALSASEQLRTWLPADEFQIGFMEDKLPIYEAVIRLTRRAATPAQVLAALNLAPRMPLAHAEAQPGGEVTPERAALQARLAGLREAWHWQQSKAEQTLAAAATSTQAPTNAIPDRDRRTLHTLETEMAEIGRRLAVSAGAAPLSAAAAPSGRWDESAAAAFVQAQQARLSHDEGLLVYFLADDSLHALALTPAGLSPVITLAPETVLQRLLRTWRFHLQTVAAGSGAETLTLAHALLARFQALLVQPLEAYLTEATRLLVALPPTWHDLPLAACFDGQHYLIERRQLALLTIPTVPLPDAPRPAGGPALVIGHTDGGRLPQAAHEASGIAAQLHGQWKTDLLLEQQATLTQARAASRAASLLHLATHALFRPDNPLFSWLRLADGRLTVADLYEWQLPARPLVVLSACETGHGQPRGGGLLGMGRGFLAAGASGLIVSLWKVADAASAVLMTEFYRQLTERGLAADPAVCLQQAQRHVLTIHPHPFFWAGFVAIKA